MINKCQASNAHAAINEQQVPTRTQDSELQRRFFFASFFFLSCTVPAKVFVLPPSHKKGLIAKSARKRQQLFSKNGESNVTASLFVPLGILRQKNKKEKEDRAISSCLWKTPTQKDRSK